MDPDSYKHIEKNSKKYKQQTYLQKGRFKKPVSSHWNTNDNILARNLFQPSWILRVMVFGPRQSKDYLQRYTYNFLLPIGTIIFVIFLLSS